MPGKFVVSSNITILLNSKAHTCGHFSTSPGPNPAFPASRGTKKPPHPVISGHGGLVGAYRYLELA